jgi:hypothetical protein
VRWLNPDEEPAGKTVILSEETVAQKEALLSARERAAKADAGGWMRWTVRSRSEDGRVGATAE